MTWKDLLQKKDESVVLPWVGEQKIFLGQRGWTVRFRPPEHGWCRFSITGREARFMSVAEVDFSVFAMKRSGYLVGNRIVADDVKTELELATICELSQIVDLIEPGLDKFARVLAGSIHPQGRLVFIQQEMPLGPETDVLQAFLDEKPSIRDIKNVIPSLDLAFRMETWQREQTRRRRAEIEREVQEAQERLRIQEQQDALFRSLGDGGSRRRAAVTDFGVAAQAALRIGGAEYIDHRLSPQSNEMIVRFRFADRRFECTCERRTLRIIDSGICLRDESTGEAGDNRFTLESLPSVIQEAMREGVLVIFRHA